MSACNKRIAHIDALRGLAILLVVYSHVLMLLASNTNLSELNGFFIKFRMPLFFFISGYFVYSSRYDSNLLKKRTLNRMNRQLLPTLFFWILYCFLIIPISWESIIRLPLNPDKNGYWFTFVSVEYFLLFAPIIFIFCKYRLQKHIQNLCFLCLGVIFFSLYGLSRMHYSSSIVIGISSTLCLDHFLKYSVFFIYGILYKINHDEINKYVLSYWAIFIYITIALSVLHFHPFHYGFINEAIVSIALVALIFTLTYHIYRSTIISNSHLSVLLQYIGQMTLEIYLLHYFVIYVLSQTSINVTLYKYINTWLEFPVFIALSFVIVGICCTFVWILRKANIYEAFFKPSMLKSN